MSIQVRQAQKKQKKAKIAIAGGPGCGKTYTALRVGQELVDPTLNRKAKVLMIDTEQGSSELYADEFSFDVVTPKEYTPESVTEYIDYAEKNGYDVLVLDSFSHFWIGEGGALDRVGGQFANWKNVTPKFNRMIDRLIDAKVHIICCMRLKVAYEVVENEKGKKEPKRLGLEPIMRNDIEYTFNVYGTLDQTNTLAILKTRHRKQIPLNSTWYQPGEAFASALLQGCGEGEVEQFVLPAEIRTKFDELAADMGEEAFVPALKALGYDSVLAIPSVEAARAAYQSLRTKKGAAA
jgi:hypothetical protein